MSAEVPIRGIEPKRNPVSFLLHEVFQVYPEALKAGGVAVSALILKTTTGEPSIHDSIIDEISREGDQSMGQELDEDELADIDMSGTELLFCAGLLGTADLIGEAVKGAKKRVSNYANSDASVQVFLAAAAPPVFLASRIGVGIASLAEKIGAVPPLKDPSKADWRI